MGRFLRRFLRLNLNKLLELGNPRPGLANPRSRSLVVPRCPIAPACKSLREGKEAKDVDHATIRKDHRLNHRPRKTVPQTDLPMPPSQTLTVIALIQLLLKDMASPEAAVAFGLEQTEQMSVTLEGRMAAVQKGIEATLHGGPADADALFDFHHIRLAFEPVWQELFDEKLIATGKTLYEQFVEIGVDPNEYLNITPNLGPVGLAVTLDTAKALFKTDQKSTPSIELESPSNRDGRVRHHFR